MSAPRLGAHRNRCRRRIRRDDAGFSLLEAMVAIAVVAIVMTSVTALFARTITASSLDRSQQSAATLTTSALDRARSVGAIDAPLGRGHAAVTAQFAAFAASPVGPWLTSMDPLSSESAYAADLPTTPVTQTVGGTVFSVNYFVGGCHRQLSFSARSIDCTNDARETGLDYVELVRVVVAVTWPSSSCSGGTCYKIGAILLNGDSDPQFNLNADPQPPVLHDCLDQTVQIGSPLNPGDLPVLAIVQPNEPLPLCRLDGGIPPLTWSWNALPSGLEIFQERDEPGYGDILGTPDGTPGAVVTTLTVKDATGAESTGNPFTWTVEDPQPSVETPPTQYSRVGEPFSLALNHFCPPAETCSFSIDAPQPPAADGPADDPSGEDPSGDDPGDGSGGDEPEPSDEPSDGAAPAWSFDVDGNGVINGTAASEPMTLSPIVVTITTSSGKQASTGPFTWVFTDGPILPPLGDMSTTYQQAGSMGAGGDCGTYAPCGYSVTGPSWVGIDAGGTISGTAPAGGSYPVTVTLTDANGTSASSSFIWVVASEMTLTIPDQTTVSKVVSSACTSVTATLDLLAGVQIDGVAPTVPVSFVIKTQPTASWLAFNGTSKLAATAACANGDTDVTVVASAGPDGPSATATFHWAIKPVLAINGISNQTTTYVKTTGRGGSCTPYSTTVSLAGLVTGATGSVTFTVKPAVSGASISGSTLTLTSPSCTGSSSAVTVVATDSASNTASTSFTWTWKKA